MKNYHEPSVSDKSKSDDTQQALCFRQSENACKCPMPIHFKLFYILLYIRIKADITNRHCKVIFFSTNNKSSYKHLCRCILNPILMPVPIQLSILISITIQKPVTIPTSMERKSPKANNTNINISTDTATSTNINDKTNTNINTTENRISLPLPVLIPISISILMSVPVQLPLAITLHLLNYLYEVPKKYVWHNLTPFRHSFCLP